MKIKLVALDLDDTTLRSDSTLADETLAALKETASAGVEIVVASGRAFTSLPRVILELEGVNYAISSNGSAVSTVKTGERIFSATLPGSVAEEIIRSYPDAMQECFMEGQPYCESSYYADPLSFGARPAYVNYIRTTRIAVPDIRAFMRENIDRLDSIDVICPSPEKKAEYYERGRSIRGANVTSSAPGLVEFVAEGVGKGSALRRLCSRLGVPADSVAAFGNGDNDADMLAFAGFGVAVKNATEYCRQSADYICESNDELGVAKTLRKLISD
ncbi:MAG: HAD family phosphatase [Oscillospiraceae bacterium]|nr:HAD family phosphatase [Oscillospiraceae bacterium]